MTAAAGGVGGRPGPDASGAFTHRQIITILIGLMMGMFLAALDQTIVATAIRTIADDLNGFSLQAWATTAFLITSTISTPLYGKLSDIYGRRPFFIFAIAVFIAGSALCGLADSMYQLAIFRAIQGVGAGGLMSLALAIIGDIVPPRERARYQGYFLAVFGTSSVLGPILGGFFADAGSVFGVAGWRWIFYINVPIGLAAMVVVLRVLHLPHHRQNHRIDWPGALALIVALVPLLTVAEQGRTWGWDSGRSILCYVVGAVGLVLFLLAERAYGDEALLPLRLFRQRTMAVSAGASTILGMAMFGGLVTLPLYLQIVKGSSPTIAGLQLIPFVLGIMAGSVVAGQLISRTGRYRVFPIIGSLLMVVALGLFSLIGADTPLWRTMLIMLLMGLGLGGNMQPMITAVQNAVSPREIGVATSAVTFFRQMGGTLGAAVFLSVLFSLLPDKIGSALGAARATPEFQQAVAADPAQARILERVQAQQNAGGGALDDTSFISQLTDVVSHPVRVGFSEAM
ncbi:MAG TPA: MDR family MFS transporter, partial [Catenuloplanes sp.]